MTEPWTDLARFRAWCAKVAASLGMVLDGGFEACWGARITALDGTRGYELTLPERSRMTTITPVYPRSSYNWYGQDSGSIRCSTAREPAEVAADITRRLAPLYEANLVMLAAYGDEEARQQARRARLTADMRALFTKGRHRFRASCHDGHRTDVTLPGPRSLGGSARFQGPAEEVEFTRFRVPADVAVAMIAVYAEHTNQSGDWEPYQLRPPEDGEGCPSP